MADQVTRVEYYMGTIPNKPGEGAKILNAIKDAGVNLTGFLGYPKKARTAEVILVVEEKAPSLTGVAKKAGVELARKQKGFLISGEDRPGAMAELASKIAEAGINIVSVHGLCAGAGRYTALLVVDAADLRKATKVLGV